MRTLLLTFFISIITLNSLAQPTSEECVQYLNKNARSPSEYVISKFDQYDIVMLGEDHGIKQNLDFVASLVPALYAKGVYNLGMEFGASEKQKQMDSLLSAKVYNSTIAREMMYYYNNGWPYLEYYTICEAIWKFNQTLAPAAPKFRIINLSYQYDWSGYKKEDVRTDEVMTRIFHKGTPDQYRARLVETEVMAKKQKALLLVGTPHAFTKYGYCHYDFLKDNFVYCDTDWLGQRLLQRYPNKAFNILLHQPFGNMPGKTPWLISPGGGMVEQVMTLNQNKPVGFDLAETPMGKIRDESRNSIGFRNFMLGQFFDGYVFLAPFQSLVGCTMDPTFFNSKTWAQISPQIPDRDWRAPISNLDDYKQQIAEFVNISMRYKDVIK
jgi:hypothetical protein